MTEPPSGSEVPGARRSIIRKKHDETAPNLKPILVMEEVYKYFRRDIPTLRNVNLTVHRGEFVFVTGPSGSGKSTLLQLIYRQHTVDSGRILFSGRDVSRLTDKSIPFLRRNLGIVFQDFKVVPHWTVFENVSVALEIIGAPARVLRVRVSEALERVGLAGRGNDRTGALSGGEQQRVAIARALVKEPLIVIADEPTANLDSDNGEQVISIMQRLNSELGTTFLISSHDARVIAHARRILTLRDGQLVKDEHPAAEKAS